MHIWLLNIFTQHYRPEIVVQYADRVMGHIKSCVVLSGGHFSAVTCFETVTNAFLSFITDPTYDIQMKVWDINCIISNTIPYNTIQYSAWWKYTRLPSLSSCVLLSPQCLIPFNHSLMRIRYITVSKVL